HAVGQTQPEVEPRPARFVAVVVADAADPHAAEGGGLRLGEGDGVLDGDARLIVVAGEHPPLELGPRPVFLVHEGVIAVMVVVARLALPAHPRHEVVARQRRARRRDAHRLTSMPSQATCQPATSTWRRSAESSRRIGFVLFTWM